MIAIMLSLALSATSWCSLISTRESANATIKTYSCVTSDGGHYMKEVSCPHSGGMCSEWTY